MFYRQKYDLLRPYPIELRERAVRRTAQYVWRVVRPRQCQRWYELILGVKVRATTKLDLKRIVEDVLQSLDVDCSVFDIAEGSEPGDWKVTFFDRNRSSGQSIFHVSLNVGSNPSEGEVKDHISSHLERTFSRGGHTG